MVNKCYYWRSETLYLELYVRPKSTITDIVGLYNNRLKVVIKASPVCGKANKILLKFLSQYFDVSIQNVEIISGLYSTYKTISVVNPKSNLILFPKIY